MLEASQNRISIGSRARPASHVVTCRATERRVMSCRIVSCHATSCHVGSCHVVSCVSCRVMSMGVFAISCRVMSRSVVSCRVMWWSPNGGCAEASFAQGSVSHTAQRIQLPRVAYQKTSWAGLTSKTQWKVRLCGQSPSVTTSRQKLLTKKTFQRAGASPSGGSSRTRDAVPSFPLLNVPRCTRVSVETHKRNQD